MMGRFSRIGAIILACLALAAYDTRVETAIPWQSIYQAGQPASIPEHTMISDDTFDYLDPSGQLRGLFGRSGSASLDLVDINASFFRNPDLYGVEPFGDNPETEAEERRIPAPGLFAGLPDYSYAIYDWLNKNRTCPPFNDAEYTWRCHEFKGWLGGLNSVHFGSQAAEMYAHLHGNALILAQRARSMREAMTPVERESYAAELEEAELLALAYEGYAQHFLQDRWAMGHMWERWNAPDPAQEDALLPAHLAIGALAGLTHGAEALVSTTPLLGFLLMEADPMSSPLPGDNGAAEPMHYRHVRADGSMSEPLPGTGDERYADMVAGVFSLSRYDASRANQTLAIPAQMQSLRECAGAGWAEVIRAFGPGDGNGYGQFQAPLSSAAPTFSVVDREDCWNNWATNESMLTGLLGPNPERAIAMLGSLDLALPRNPDLGASGNNALVADRTEVVAYATRLWLYAQDDPDGVDVSTGNMTSAAQTLGSLVGWGEEFDPNTMWGFEHGGRYSLPEYAVPPGLSTERQNNEVLALAVEDHRGRDVQTLYGVFSGAQSDYWCEHRDIFVDLRTDPILRNREVCELLAQRMFQGSFPDYQGPQAAERDFAGEPTRSICQIRETSGVESDLFDDPDNPYWLDQGYFPAPDHEQTMTPRNTDFEAITNWCANTPILDLVNAPELRDANIAERISEDDDRMTLVGQDFGRSPGEVSLIHPVSGEEIHLDTVLSWNHDRIEIDVSDIELEDGLDYRLAMTIDRTTPDGGQMTMPGLYYLRISEPPEIQYNTFDLGGVGPCMDEVPAFEIVDVGAFLQSSFSIAGLSDIAARYAEDVEPLTAYLRRQADCMRSLRETGLPIMTETDLSFYVGFIARQGNYSGTYLNPSPVGVIELVNEDADPQGSNWIDYYSSYIRNVDGLAWYLERSANVLLAWDEALNGEEPLNHNGISFNDWLAVADTPEAALAAGFEPGRNPFRAAVSGPAAEFMREAADQAIGSIMQVHLISVGPTSQTVTREMLEGLPRWTQIQHTLVHQALPELRASAASVSSQLELATARRLADYPPEGCVDGNEPACTLHFDRDELDASRFESVSQWINVILGQTGQMTPSSTATNGSFRGPNGHDQTFFAWPPEAAAEAARSGPDGAGGAPTDDN